MKRIQGISLLLALVTSLAACATEPPYDPDADAELGIANGKVDGIFDIIPEMEFDVDETGTISDDDIEFYRIPLRRADNVTVTMQATSGTLDPHVSFYYGSSIYVSSDSWTRSGDTLTKVYTADSTGTFLVAARTYQQTGSGDYSINIHCNDGPCAGNFPDPIEFFTIGEVEECFLEAQPCTIAALPAFNGAVGPARSKQILQECLNSVATVDGDSCSSACDWVNPNDSSDDARYTCDRIEASLPWFADQSGECVQEFESCMDECLDIGSWGGGFDDEFGITPIATCLSSGLNGDCPSYVTDLSACGGEIAPDSSGECELHCQSTTGAFIDDTSDLCGVDADCDSLCDVDIALAGAACGGVSAANESCLITWLEDHWAYSCEDALSALL